MKPKQVKVFAPATIANLGAGFDVLGLALEQPGDVVIAERRNEKGLEFSVHSSSFQVPTGEQNVAAHVAEIMLAELNPPFGISMQLHKKMPIGSGLGSSGASCAAAALAVNALLLKSLNRKDLVRFAIEGERLATGSAHADNVAPSILGGVCLIRSYQPLDIIQLPVKNNLFWVVVHPHIHIRTQEARDRLPKQIPLADATAQLGNLGALVAGLVLGDCKLIGKSILDYIAEPVRAALIPAFQEAKQAALLAGASAFSISGSGPSVFAVAKSLDTAQHIADNIKQAFLAFAQIDSDTYISLINQEGAKIMETSA